MDGRTDRIPISTSRIGVLTSDKMYSLWNTKIWDPLLISVITKLATSYLVQNFQFAQQSIKTTFRSKISRGLG